MLYRNGTYTAWHSAKPFRYLVVDDFLEQAFADEILKAYPAADSSWNGTTFIHQRKKFRQAENLPEPLNRFFLTVNSAEFVRSLSVFTGIESLLADTALHGGGCHQIIDGGFLDVHVDFNRHPESRLYRRLNLIVYMNKDWREEYGGYLELWDMRKRERIENIAPIFNRLVMFETNEISYHGHPVPLKVPAGVTRKSLAVYYYAEHGEEARERNTRFVNTTGLLGMVKAFSSGAVALLERALPSNHRVADRVGSRSTQRHA